MASPYDSREGTPIDMNSPFGDEENISMSEFVKTHRENILKLINSNTEHDSNEFNNENCDENPRELAILVSDDLTGPNYYTRGLGVEYGPYDETPTAYIESEDDKDLAASLAGMAKMSKPEPLDTTHDTLDRTSPSKTPPAPITKERKKSLEENSSSIPSSPLPLVRQNADDPNSDKPSNPSLSDVKDYMKKYDVVAHEADRQLRLSNKEYELDLPPNLECEHNMVEEVELPEPADNLNITLHDESFYDRDEDEDDIDDDDDDDDDGVDERKEYFTKLEERMGERFLELYEKQMLVENLTMEVNEKLKLIERKEKNNKPFNRLFDMSVVIFIGWGVMKVINFISSH